MPPDQVDEEGQHLSLVLVRVFYTLDTTNRYGGKFLERS